MKEWCHLEAKSIVAEVNVFDIRIGSHGETLEAKVYTLKKDLFN